MGTARALLSEARNRSKHGKAIGYAAGRVLERLESRIFLSVTFGPVNSSSALTHLTSGLVFSADFNGNGSTDLLVNEANGGQSVAGDISEILWGNGDGSFSSITAGPSVGLVYNNVAVTAVGDVNGDGKPDVIEFGSQQNSDGSFTNQITSFINEGNGTFDTTATTTIADSDAPLTGDPMAIADFNSDGKADLLLAFASTSGSDVTFIKMLGNGNGTFTEAQTYDVNLGPDLSHFQFFTGNFFNDGHTDIAAVAAVSGGANIALFENNGNGSLTLVQRAITLANTTTTPAVAAGDFNGDGVTDLAFLSIEGEANSGNSVLQVWLNQGPGQFFGGTATNVQGTLSSTNPLAAGDFSGDGHDDLLVNQIPESEIGAEVVSPSAIANFGQAANDWAAMIYQVNTDGSLQSPITAVSNLAAPLNGFSAIDLNGDGRADIAGVVWNGLGIDYVEDAINTTTPTTLTGSVDSGNMNEIDGWAYDPSDPTATIQVEVEISGGPTQTFTANEPRSDLGSALGSDDHAFIYATPMLSTGTHTATVFAIMTDGKKVPIGTATLVSQNSLFDEHYYLANNPDVAAAVAAGTIATGYDHYIQFGQFEGRSPSPFWNEAFYLKENPDVAAAVKAGTVSSGFMQFYLNGQYENRPGVLYFDEDYYLANNPDVAAAVSAGTIGSAYEHFVLYGQYEGRNPSQYFSTAVYETDNPSIASEITGEPYSSAYDQFVEQGQYEGLVASDFYNEQTYLTDNPDVAAAVNMGIFPDGFQHWLEYGRLEGRTAV